MLCVLLLLRLTACACVRARVLAQGSLLANNSAGVDSTKVLQSGSVGFMNTILRNAHLEACEKRRKQPSNKANARYPESVVKKSKICTVADLVSSTSEDEDDESRCIYCDGLPLPASRPRLKCAGDGCSVWAHLDCTRFALDDGSRRLSRQAFCEACLTQKPELAKKGHICLDPSEKRLQAYAAERAEQPDDDASQHLSSLPTGLSSDRGVIDALFEGLEDDTKSDSGSSYVESELEAPSNDLSAPQRSTRSKGEPQRTVPTDNDRWRCTRSGCLAINKAGVTKCRARNCEGDRSKDGLVLSDTSGSMPARRSVLPTAFFRFTSSSAVWQLTSVKRTRDPNVLEVLYTSAKGTITVSLVSEPDAAFFARRLQKAAELDAKPQDEADGDSDDGDSDDDDSDNGDSDDGESDDGDGNDQVRSQHALSRSTLALRMRLSHLSPHSLTHLRVTARALLTARAAGWRRRRRAGRDVERVFRRHGRCLSLGTAHGGAFQGGGDAAGAVESAQVAPQTPLAWQDRW